MTPTTFLVPPGHPDFELLHGDGSPSVRGILDASAEIPDPAEGEAARLALAAYRPAWLRRLGLTPSTRKATPCSPRRSTTTSRRSRP